MTSPARPEPQSPVPCTNVAKLHKGVEAAVHLMWNNQYDAAAELLVSKKDTSPRYALEYAVIFMIRSLLNPTNEQREGLLERFKVADGLATAAKYGHPMVSDSSDEETEAAIANTVLEDRVELSERDIKELEKQKAAQRAKDKEAFKKQQKVSQETGAQVDQSWKLECDVIYADALLVRSLVQLTMNSYIKGGLNLRKTWMCYHALLKEVEADKAGAIPQEIVYNIKCGAGMFLCYLALVPAGMMKVLSAIGFISDKELGEQYLTEVLRSDSIRGPFAGLTLLTYYLFLPTALGNVEETLAKAKAILDLMNTRYPQNSYFRGYSNMYHRKRGETAEAVAAMTEATKNAEVGGAVPTLLRYLQGDTYYMDLQFDKARDSYKALLDQLEESGESFAYTGQVVISLAGCYMMMGDPDTAMMWVKRVGAMYNPKSKQDSNSPKYAARVVAEPKLLPLIGVYVLYINRDLAHMKAAHVVKLQECMDRVAAPKAGQPLPPEVQGMYHLFTGVMMKGQGQKQEALDELEKIFVFEKKMASDSMVLPYAYYEIGELEYRNGRLQKAKRLFEKGMSLKGDGHETLANRFNLAMRQLKREMKEKGME